MMDNSSLDNFFYLASTNQPPEFMPVVLTVSILVSVVYTSTVVLRTMSRRRKKIELTSQQLQADRIHYFNFSIIFFVIAVMSFLNDQLFMSLVWLLNSSLWLRTYRNTKKLIRLMQEIEETKKELQQWMNKHENSNKS